MMQSRNTPSSHLVALESEVPMSVGSKSAHAARQAAHAANPVSLPRRALLALCSLLLAVQLVPGTAWATSGESPSPAVTAAVQDAGSPTGSVDAPSVEDGSGGGQPDGSEPLATLSTEPSDDADDGQAQSTGNASPSATVPAADTGMKADAERTAEPTAGAEKTAEPTAEADDAQTVTVTVRVIGPDAEGNDADWLAAQELLEQTELRRRRHSRLRGSATMPRTPGMAPTSARSPRLSMARPTGGTSRPDASGSFSSMAGRHMTAQAV